MRRARLDRRLPHGDADGARGRGRLGPAPPRRPALRPGLDLRGARRRRGRGARRGTTRRCRAIADDKAERLRWEKETLGLYVSEHPLEGDPRPAPAQDRLRPRRGRAPARRRGRHGRRDRRRDQAADDEEGRPDGLHAPRRRHRRRRGRGLQLRLRRRARADRDRPRARRQGPRRPQAGGRDEAARDRGLGLRGDPRAARGAPARRRPARAGRRDPRAGDA